MVATYLGTALAARDDVIRDALQRVPPALGRPISTLPKIQRLVGEMDVALQAAVGEKFAGSPHVINVQLINAHVGRDQPHESGNILQVLLHQCFIDPLRRIHGKYRPLCLWVQASSLVWPVDDARDYPLVIGDVHIPGL